MQNNESFCEDSGWVRKYEYKILVAFITEQTWGIGYINFYL